MKTKPLFDHSQIEQVMSDARIQRAKYLRNKSAEATGVVRWGGLGAVAAACLALLAGHSLHAKAGVTGSDTNQSVTRTS